MIDFISKYGRNVFSQNCEDGIIEEVLKRIQTHIKNSDGGAKRIPLICVEFGAADGFFFSNTRNLINKGWKGHLYDYEAKGDVEARVITPENVNELPKCDVLSIDIDGNDYNVWNAYKGKPAIVIIEINSSIEPDKDEPVSDSRHGTAYKPMKELGESKGYFLLCHTGNLIFVDKKYEKLFPDADETFNKQWLH